MSCFKNCPFSLSTPNLSAMWNRWPFTGVYFPISQWLNNHWELCSHVFLSIRFDRYCINALFCLTFFSQRPMYSTAMLFLFTQVVGQLQHDYGDIPIYLLSSANADAVCHSASSSRGRGVHCINPPGECSAGCAYNHAVQTISDKGGESFIPTISVTQLACGHTPQGVLTQGQI